MDRFVLKYLNDAEIYKKQLLTFASPTWGYDYILVHYLTYLSTVVRSVHSIYGFLVHLYITRPICGDNKFSYPNFSVSKCHYRTQVQCLFAVSVRHSMLENLNPVELCSCSHRDGCEEVGRTRSAIPLRSVPLQTTTCVLQAFCVKILC